MKRPAGENGPGEGKEGEVTEVTCAVMAEQPVTLLISSVPPSHLLSCLLSRFQGQGESNLLRVM